MSTTGRPITEIFRLALDSPDYQGDILTTIECYLDLLPAERHKAASGIRRVINRLGPEWVSLEEVLEAAGCPHPLSELIRSWPNRRIFQGIPERTETVRAMAKVANFLSSDYPKLEDAAVAAYIKGGSEGIDKRGLDKCIASILQYKQRLIRQLKLDPELEEASIGDILRAGNAWTPSRDDKQAAMHWHWRWTPGRLYYNGKNDSRSI